MEVVGDETKVYVHLGSVSKWLETHEKSLSR